MRVWVLPAMAAILSFAANSAFGAGVRDKVHLNWVAPAACPQKSEFLASLTRMLVDRVTTDETLHAEVVIVKAEAGTFQLTLTTKLGASSGHRVLQGRECNVVADAAAVTLALLLNPDFEITSTPKPDNGGSNSTSTTARKVLAPSTPAVGEQRVVLTEVHRERFHGLFSSRVGAEWGVLPRANPQLSLGVGVGRERGSIWANGSYSAPQNATIASPNVGGRLWTASLAVAGCWLWTRTSPRFGSCLGAEMTRLNGRGTGVTHARSATTTWLSPSLSMNADFALHSHAWLRLDVAGKLPLARPNTHLDDLGTVQKPEKIVGNLNAGIVVSF